MAPPIFCLERLPVQLFTERLHMRWLSFEREREKEKSTSKENKTRDCLLSGPLFCFSKAFKLVGSKSSPFDCATTFKLQPIFSRLAGVPCFQAQTDTLLPERLDSQPASPVYIYEEQGSLQAYSAFILWLSIFDDYHFSQQ